MGQLLSHIEALEARILELEGPRKPPTDGVKERKPPSWVKANRPARPKKERVKRSHGFARRRDEPTHRVEHATANCPDCGISLQGGRVCGSPPGDYPAPGTGAGNRARGVGTHLSEVPEAVGPGTGLECYNGGPEADGDLGAE